LVSTIPNASNVCDILASPVLEVYKGLLRLIGSRQRITLCNKNQETLKLLSRKSLTTIYGAAIFGAKLSGHTSGGSISAAISAKFRLFLSPKLASQKKNPNPA
jgi:hypothetical protein